MVSQKDVMSDSELDPGPEKKNVISDIIVTVAEIWIQSVCVFDNILSQFNFLNLIIVLWLRKRVPLLLGNICQS